MRYAITWNVKYTSVAEINQLNILNARLLTIKRAVDNLSINLNLILVDGYCSSIF